MTTKFSKSQLNTILSALDDQPRNPNTAVAAFKAIEKSAARYGLTLDDVLAAAPGLLDERLSPADFRAELRELAERPESADTGQEAATEPQEPMPAEEEPDRRPSRHRLPTGPRRRSPPRLRGRNPRQPRSRRPAPAPSRLR